MNMNQYQELAERTAMRGPDDTDRERFANFAMGLAGESGEVVDYLKKVVFHGHKLDREKLCDELGDCLWYIATIANTAGINLYTVAMSNIKKLQKRYPEGFDAERSICREENQCK